MRGRDHQSPPPSPLLELRAVARHLPSKAGPLPIVQDVSLSLWRGQSLAIIGESGSGKSSLLELMGTLSRPQSGDVLFAGRSLRAISAREKLALRRHKIGFVFQSANLIDHFTAAANVALPLRYSGLPRHLRRGRALSWLERVGLGHLADRSVAKLSGGERQRVALARALVNEPELILADEPTGSLDHATGRDILELMLSLVSPESSLVVVTHNISQISAFARVAHMEQGRLTERSHAQALRGA
ncbi:MAG: ABC transporter ATP-binding protein [Mangrovicoccus sp.]